MNQSERRIWLIQELQKEMPEYAHYPIPKTSEEQWRFLRGQKQKGIGETLREQYEVS